MAYPLIGLISTLSDEACSRVALRLTDGAATFARDATGLWASEDQESEAVHSEELAALIQERLGKDCAAVECDLNGERITYELERGALRVRREPHAARAPEGSQGGPEFEPLINAMGIPKSKRRPKLLQALRFAKIAEGALACVPGATVRVLDLACGRSYLGFVLVQHEMARGISVRLHGVDSNPVLLDKCRAIADELKWSNCVFEQADLAQYSPATGAHDVAVSLHACDTLTDEAIRIGWEARCRHVLLAPCCQHELRHCWKDHPLEWVSRYGLIEQRLADVLTDGYRCLVLEALGYRVKTLRFTSPDVTPKNLLIHAELSSRPDHERADAAWAFSRQFGARLRLASVLIAAGFESPF